MAHSSGLGMGHSDHLPICLKQASRRAWVVGGSFISFLFFD
eukprot:COSAG01_NODE_5951_length_3938_cov_35.878875_2_plen_41_part_00